MLTIIILGSLLLLVNSQPCHYSCATCLTPSYTSCLTCSANINVQFLPSSPTGVCLSSSFSNANAVGVILLIICVIASAAFKSKIVWWYAIGIQTMGLLSFIEIDWMAGVQYIFGGCSYLMLFSVMGKNALPYDVNYSSHSLFRLGDQLHSTNLAALSPAIFALSVVSFLILVSINPFQMLHKKFCIDQCTFMTESFLAKIRFGAAAFYLMTIQQMMLMIYTSIRLGHMDAGMWAIAIVYALSLIGFGIYINILPIPLFPSIQVQNIVIFSRVILPVIPALPPSHHYLLLLFLPFLCILSFLLVSKNPSQSSRLKFNIYRLIELIVFILLGIQYILEMKLNSTNASLGIGIIALISLVVWIGGLIFQICLEIRRIYKGQDAQNKQYVFQYSDDLTKEPKIDQTDMKHLPDQTINPTGEDIAADALPNDNIYNLHQAPQIEDISAASNNQHEEKKIFKEPPVPTHKRRTRKARPKDQEKYPQNMEKDMAGMD